VTKDFPVLSAGPTQHTALDRWSLSVGRGGQQKTWSWAEFRALPSQDVTVDIHCVTKWSKLDTVWQGVSVDTLLDLAGMTARSRWPTATGATRSTTGGT
jgi:DMSO/TMAO reductase YedYZ molybdopterin-dependent catalytic subunit